MPQLVDELSDDGNRPQVGDDLTPTFSVIKLLSGTTYGIIAKRMVFDRSSKAEASKTSAECFII